MKTLFWSLALVGCLSACVWADEGGQLRPGPPSAPEGDPKVNGDMPITDYDGTVEKFKAFYKQMGKPRMLLYVNRNLIKDRGEMVEMASVDTSVKTKGDSVDNGSSQTVQIGSGNTVNNTGSTPTGKGGEKTVTVGTSVRTFEDDNKGVTPVTEIEVREIEQVFQEAFSEAGGRFVDQKIAQISNMSFSNPGENFLTAPKTDKERQDVESLRKATDVVIELLARKKPITIPQVSGNDLVVLQLELNATAISMKDGLKLGQVSSNSLFKFNRRFGKAAERRAKKFSNAEITEQVALALMQRMGE
jgi:hypothetical protein